jgi:hypothetical protein
MNYLYALPPQKLSPCAAIVRDELRQVLHRLVQAGEWRGVELHPPQDGDVQPEVDTAEAMAH